MTDVADMRVPVVFAAAELAGAEDALVLDAGEGAAFAADAGEGAAFAADAGEGAAFAAGVLVRLPASAIGHRFGCTCCMPRGAAAEALGRLFVARARGEIRFFRRVVVSVADAAAVREAVLGDRLVAGRYRLDTAAAAM